MLFLVVGTSGRDPEAAALAAPTAMMAGSAAYLLAEQQRYECDCEIPWERVERVLDYLDEMFTFSSSTHEINKGRLTLSCRCYPRPHPHLLYRRLRLPLRLPRLALVE